MEWLTNNGEVTRAIEYIVDGIMELPFRFNGNQLSEAQKVDLYNPMLDVELREMIRNYYFGLFYDGVVYFVKFENGFYIAREKEVKEEHGRKVVKVGEVTSTEYYKIVNRNEATGKIEPRYKGIENEIKEKYYSQKNNITLLENGLIIREILTFKEIISENKIEKLKDQFKRQYSNALGKLGFDVDKSTTMIVNGNQLDYNVLSANLADIQNTQLANKNKDVIYNYLGVPPQLMGSETTATYSNYKEAQVNFLKNTVLPAGSKFAMLLTKYYFEEKGIIVTVDGDEVKRNINGTSNVFTEMQILRDMGLITDEQFMNEIGYGHLVEKGGD